MKEPYTNIDYRNAKIIRIVKKEEERYLYKNREISKEEAMEIMQGLTNKKESEKQLEE